MAGSLPTVLLNNASHARPYSCESVAPETLGISKYIKYHFDRCDLLCVALPTKPSQENSSMSRTLRIASLAAVFAMSAFMAGCAGPAPNYSPSIANVEAIKTSGAAASKVVPIAVAAEMPGGKSMSMRANSMTSPVGAHFGDYISAALRQELELAKLHNPQAGTEISGSLLRNNIDAGGISTNEGQIEVRFVVKRGDQERFNKVKRIEHKWESSFAAAVAIPLAANNYPVMVQKLIATLVSDPDFIQALRN